ncbi:MAG: vWA domain-containing protein [Polyangiales bacterium]
MSVHHPRAFAVAAVLLALACACAAEPDRIQLTERPPRASGSGRNPATLGGVIETSDSDADAGVPLCDVVQLVAKPQVPDMMVMLDRSTSMEQGGRWRPSVSAVRSLTMKLESSVRFGLALFPGVGFGGFRGSLLCSPGEITVPAAERNAARIARSLSVTWPSGGTPTSDTLRVLLDTYAVADTGPDSEPHPKYILLVTDGAPTCPDGAGTETTPPDVDAANAALDALREQGVRTYVVGYDTTGPGNEMLTSVLDGFAARGGTGDEQHRPVEDEASLVSELQQIASAITSCDFSLDKTPPSADHVLVQLDGEQLNLGEPDGWRLVGDRTIQLVGAACDRFRDGTHSVSAEIRCAIVTPG